MKKTLVWLLLFMLMVLPACNPDTVDEPITDIPLAPSESATPSSEHEEELLAQELLIRANGDFALDLYKELRDEDSNLFYSPYSISMALAMTCAGARGETAEQMERALNLSPELADGRFHSAFYELSEELAERGKGQKMGVVEADGELVEKNMEEFRLNIVNALWGQQGYDFLPEYLDLVESYYGGGLRTLDFIGEPESSRLEINDWASEQTEGRIEDLLPSGLINPLTRLVLTNAIYFKARWQHEFSERTTQDDIFFLLDSSEVTVPMMHQRARFDYIEGDDYQSVRLPYLGEEIAMVILLPAEGRFVDFENSLESDRLNAIIEDMEHREVELALPKFEFETGYELGNTLTDLGIKDAFDQGLADFSGMTGNRELFIGEAIHKAFVSVDEEGTEAAAVTAIGMAGSAPPSGPVDFTANRPFIFLIQDMETGIILFVGRVMNPVA